MTYDPKIRYTVADLREIPPKELRRLFEEAKKTSADVRGIVHIRKVTKDISNMRLLLNGFNSIYNEEHK